MRVPGGPHAGETAVPALPHQDCFLTDQRTFSSNRRASARMHSEVEIDLVCEGVTSRHWCGETIEVDCEDGSVEGRATAKTDRMRFTDWHVRRLPSGSRHATIRLSAAGANPLVAPSAVMHDVDYEGILELRWPPDRKTVQVEYRGLTNDFPAYEAYVQADADRPRELFQRKPGAGGPAKGLVGRADQPVAGAATLTSTEAREDVIRDVRLEPRDLAGGKVARLIVKFEEASSMPRIARVSSSDRSITVPPTVECAPGSAEGWTLVLTRPVHERVVSDVRVQSGSSSGRAQLVVRPPKFLHVVGPGALQKNESGKAFVILSSPAPDDGYRVLLEYNPWIQGPAQVIIPGGATDASFEVTAGDRAPVTGSITARAGGAVLHAKVAIL